MKGHARPKNRWRRFIREYGLRLFIIVFVVAVLGLVAFLMYALASPSWLGRG